MEKHFCGSRSYPIFSHLQQQQQQTRMPMMRTPASTDMVMIKIWKFTGSKENEKRTTKHTTSIWTLNANAFNESIR